MAAQDFKDVGSFGQPRWQMPDDPSVEFAERDSTAEFDVFVDGRQVGSFMHGPHGRLITDVAVGARVRSMLALRRSGGVSAGG